MADIEMRLLDVTKNEDLDEDAFEILIAEANIEFADFPTTDNGAASIKYQEDHKILMQPGGFYRRPNEI